MKKYNSWIHRSEWTAAFGKNLLEKGYFNPGKPTRRFIFLDVNNLNSWTSFLDKKKNFSVIFFDSILRNIAGSSEANSIRQFLRKIKSTPMSPRVIFVNKIVYDIHHKLNLKGIKFWDELCQCNNSPYDHSNCSNDSGNGHDGMLKIHKEQCLCRDYWFILSIMFCEKISKQTKIYFNTKDKEIRRFMKGVQWVEFCDIDEK